MNYRERIEEDKLKQIMEQNISYLDEIFEQMMLTKEDYQKYDEKRNLFTRLLSVELVRRTFLFIGFSFNAPNLERI